MKVGIDFGGMSVKYGVVDEENQIIARYTLETDIKASPTDFVEAIAKGVDSLLAQAQIPLERIDNMGVGCPGIIDRQSGKVVYSNNIDWHDVDMGRQLEAYFRRDVAMANDADTAGLGEVLAGAGKGKQSAVLLTLGTGVGSSVIMEKKIWTGPLMGGCELGHMTIHGNGEFCTCGKQGCLEAYASASALMKLGETLVADKADCALAKACQGNKVTAKMIFDCNDAGDQDCQELVLKYLHSLALGIGNVVNIFRPELIILGGGVANRKEKLTQQLTPLVDTYVFGRKDSEVPPIVTSVLGNDAGIIGAAHLCKG